MVSSKTNVKDSFDPSILQGSGPRLPSTPLQDTSHNRCHRMVGKLPYAFFQTLNVSRLDTVDACYVDKATLF